MTPERLAEIKALAHAYSGLQYVATGAHLQWPWTSAASTNQVVDLVRAVPDLLAALAAATEREQAYRAALRRLQAYHGWTVDAYARVYGEPTDDEPSRVIERVLAAGWPADEGRGEG